MKLIVVSNGVETHNAPGISAKVRALKELLSIDETLQIEINLEVIESRGILAQYLYSMFHDLSSALRCSDSILVLDASLVNTYPAIFGWLIGFNLTLGKGYGSLDIIGGSGVDSLRFVPTCTNDRNDNLKLYYYVDTATIYQPQNKIQAFNEICFGFKNLILKTEFSSDEVYSYYGLGKIIGSAQANYANIKIDKSFRAIKYKNEISKEIIKVMIGCLE